MYRRRLTCFTECRFSRSYLGRHRALLASNDSVCSFNWYVGYFDWFPWFTGELGMFSLCAASHGCISADSWTYGLKLARFVGLKILSDILMNFVDLLLTWTCYHCVSFRSSYFDVFQDVLRQIVPNCSFHWFVAYSEEYLALSAYWTCSQGVYYFSWSSLCSFVDLLTQNWLGLLFYWLIETFQIDFLDVSVDLDLLCRFARFHLFQLLTSLQMLWIESETGERQIWSPFWMSRG